MIFCRACITSLRVATTRDVKADDISDSSHDNNFDIHFNSSLLSFDRVIEQCSPSTSVNFKLPFNKI